MLSTKHTQEIAATEFGSPHWTHLELLRRKFASDRTHLIGFFTAVSMRNPLARPVWVPTLDESRTVISANLQKVRPLARDFAEAPRGRPTFQAQHSGHRPKAPEFTSAMLCQNNVVYFAVVV